MRFIKIGLGAMALAALVVLMSSGPRAAYADPAVPTNNDVAIDADPVTSGTQNAINVPVGAQFDVAAVISGTVDAWSAEQQTMYYDTSKVSYVSGPVDTNLGGAMICGGDVSVAGSLYWGCSRQSGQCTIGTNCDGVARTWKLQCVNPGVSSLHLATIGAPDNEGEGTGTNFAITAGVGDPCVSGHCHDATVNCYEVANLEIHKVPSTFTPLAGSDLTYMITFHNGGPQTANPPVVITDILPAGKEFVSCHVLSPIPADCGPAYVPPPAHMIQFPLGIPDGMGGVTPIPIPPSTTVIIQVVVHVPLSEAGKPNANYVRADALNGPADPDGAEDTVIVNVEPADFLITKTADKTSYMVDDDITYTVEATSIGPSDASAVTLSDDILDANQEITACSVDTGDTCTFDADSCDCPLANPVAVGVKVTMTLTAKVVAALGGFCDNQATVEFADPSSEVALSKVACLAEVMMLKDVYDLASVNKKDLDPDGAGPLEPDGLADLANLWLCKGAGCLLDAGEGRLWVKENVYGAGTDPDGVGAYEFQLKFDHKIFDLVITDAGWLGSTGRAVECDMSIIAENDIRWGCVSTGSVDGPTSSAEPIAWVKVLPEPDLYYRLTPGQQNGVVRILLDENCELADPLGDPLMAVDAQGVDKDSNGLDDDGDGVVDEQYEGAPLGILPGGLLKTCGDFQITVRILEGDLNLDCSVNVLDEQAIAYRYGASFGNLLYDPWYDLEPALKDFDIDIKDLQKVFGRYGSDCQGPQIPAQPPLEVPN
jgi:uncharacterized repeat protein (TIGR01451 family)